MRSTDPMGECRARGADSRTLKMSLRHFALLASLAACSCGDAGQLPESVRRGATVKNHKLPNCEIPSLPLREREHGSLEQLEQSVSDEELCHLASGLKRWMDSVPVPPPDMAPGDWARIRSLDVYRMERAPSSAGQRREIELHLYADVPERPRLIGVSMSKTTQELRFFVVHRGAG